MVVFPVPGVPVISILGKCLLRQGLEFEPSLEEVVGEEDGDGDGENEGFNNMVLKSKKKIFGNFFLLVFFYPFEERNPISLKRMNWESAPRTYIYLPSRSFFRCGDWRDHDPNCLIKHTCLPNTVMRSA